MIPLFPFATVLALNAMFVGLSFSIDTMLVALVSILLVTVGLATRKYFPVAIGAVISGLGFLALVLTAPQQTSRMWLSVGFGGAAFLLLETGYDAVHCIRTGITLKQYRYRIQYIILVILLSSLSVFVLLTISYNFSVHLPGFRATRLLYPALYLLIIIIALALGVYLKERHQGNEDQTESSALPNAKR